MFDNKQMNYFEQAIMVKELNTKRPASSILMDLSKVFTLQLQSRCIRG